MISPSPRKKFRKNTFRDAWLQDPDFALWLQKCEDPYKARCIVCKKTLITGKSTLQKHNRTLLHKRNMKGKKNEEEGVVKKSSTFISENIKEAELRFCLDIVEHCKSFNSFDHIVRMIQTALPDSNIIKNVSFKRTKISSIIKNVINKSVISETTKILQNKLLSVLIDESIDISETKNLCILSRYIHEGKIQTYLLDLVYIKDTTSEHLYECFLQSLEKHNLSLKNIVVVPIDNTNIMLGKYNSLISCLLKDKEIDVFPCICHSMHLIACRACECLPTHVEEFVHSIYSYFSKNPKRQNILESTQNLIKVARQKVIQPSANRWLALLECIKNILTQWTVLFSIFAEANIEKKSAIAKKIFHNFKCPYTKAYLQFLNYILRLITDFNMLFQSSEILIHCLLPECFRFLRCLGGHFIKPNYMEAPNLHEIDIYDENNIRPLEEIIIGEEALITLKETKNINTKDNNKKILEFYVNIKKFYQCAFENTVKKISFGDQILNSLEFLNPNIALNIKNHKNQLNLILEKFKSKFNTYDVKDEWHLLPFYFSQEEKEKLLQLNISEFWDEVGKIYKFQNIAKVANLCLSLPHSNIDMERCFSIIAEIKTKDRNRLKPEMISALTRIKLDLENKNTNCMNYEITDEMLQLFNSNMYKREYVSKESVEIRLSDKRDDSASEHSDN